MNSYEQVLIFSPEMTDEQVQQVLSKARSLIEEPHGEFIAQDIWGRRRLAYPIKRNREGLYAVLQFSVDPSNINELETLHRLNSKIIRHITVKVDKSFFQKKPVSEQQLKEEVKPDEQLKTARTE